MSFIGDFFGNLGYFFHMRSFMDKAETQYRLGMKMGGLGPKNEGAFGVLLLKKGCFEEALEHFNNSISHRDCKGQLRSLIRMNKAIALYKLGQIDMSIEILEELHTSFRSLRVYQTLGYVYTTAHMFDKAEKYNLEACDYDPQDAVILDNTGQMYMDMGQLDKAKEYFERAYQIKHISDVLYHMGFIAEHEGRLADALEHYREAMTKNMDALNEVTPEKLTERINVIRDQLGIVEEEDEI